MRSAQLGTILCISVDSSPGCGDRLWENHQRGSDLSITTSRVIFGCPQQVRSSNTLLTSANEARPQVHSCYDYDEKIYPLRGLSQTSTASVHTAPRPGFNVVPDAQVLTGANVHVRCPHAALVAKGASRQ